MNKRIFICGKVYELTATNTAATAKKIQKRVDKICNDPDTPDQRLVNFSLQVTQLPNNEQDIEFIFARNNMLAKVGSNPELINDSDAMLMMGIDGKFKPAVMWNLVEQFAFGRYHVPIFEFIPAYAETAQALNAADIIGMQIDSTKTELKLKIRI